MEQAKRLYRNRYDTVIAGVAGGLAKYFNIDPIIVRIIFVALVFPGGVGVLIYIVLCIAVPVDPDFSFHSYDFKKANGTGYAEQGYNPASESAENTADENASEKNDTSETYKPFADHEKKKSDGNLIAGVVLIVIGGLFLATRFIPHFGFRDLWPVLLIVGGILILKSSLTKPKNNY